MGEGRCTFRPNICCGVAITAARPAPLLSLSLASWSTLAAIAGPADDLLDSPVTVLPDRAFA